ncbi:MAG: phosphoribosylformylglycinamidine cyclo-ligase [Oscillospiraceae bacterium]|nr:phosphoribosylformylglycinamidine cyclo-ligase [Oscillospiraceae bacterium]
MNSYSHSYKAAGVDVTAGYESVELFKSHVNRTKIPGVLDSIGGFGGMFELDLTGIKEPVLVSGTDGVGTKLKLAFLLDKHDTVGIDVVAMCVNDIICCGAKPLYFLDYIACGKNIPKRIAEIVKGVADGCVQAGCALIGGETAEMPGLYKEDEYDLAGYCTGVADKSALLDHNNVKEGDLLIGLASSGVHSNGFSLVRKVFGIDDTAQPLDRTFSWSEKTLGEILLTPTEIYVKPLLSLLTQMKKDKGDITGLKAAAHITGGGFYENIPRALPAGLSAAINKESYTIPPIFKEIQKAGGISERDMYNTFNMGLGFVLAVSPSYADKAIEVLNQSGTKATQVGKVIKGNDGVILI